MHKVETEEETKCHVLSLTLYQSIIVQCDFPEKMAFISPGPLFSRNMTNTTRLIIK